MSIGVAILWLTWIPLLATLSVACFVAAVVTRKPTLPRAIARYRNEPKETI